jgi:PST family polysaccharide transporter
VQFASYVLPLITVPYLVRVLKPERFGTVAFGQGLIAYFMALVECGFGLPATRRISAARENHELVSRVASNVMAARRELERP